jgi:EmrB/QacA subfamily drug resistance transporter
MAARWRWAALALVCVAQFVVVLDVTIVAIALPSIQRDLGFSAAGLQWVVTAYVLVFGGFLMLAGRAADLWGRRRWFMAGLSLFATASLACGLARSPLALVAARSVQGLGAAAVAPAALAILTATFLGGRERERAVGVWTAAAAGGGATGWLLGGVLSQGLGWPWVFLVNVPVGALGLALAPVLLSESRERSGSSRLDGSGALTGTAGLALLLYGLTRAGDAGWAAPVTVGAIALALALLAAFLLLEARARDPLLPLGLLRCRDLAGASLVAAALTAATTPPVFLATLYVQQVQGRSPAEAGMEFPPLNLAVVAGSLLGPRVAAAVGARAAMVAGLVAVAAGAAAMTGIPAAGGGYLGALLPGFILMGGGLGCASVASTAAGTTATAERRGLGAGLLNAAAQVGTAIGLAVLVTVATARTGVLARHGVAAPAALVGGFRWAFLGAAALAVAGVVAALALVGREPRRARDPRHARPTRACDPAVPCGDPAVPCGGPAVPCGD